MATYRIVDMYRKSKAVKGIHYDSWDEPIYAYRVDKRHSSLLFLMLKLEEAKSNPMLDKNFIAALTEVLRYFRDNGELKKAYEIKKKSLANMANSPWMKLVMGMLTSKMQADKVDAELPDVDALIKESTSDEYIAKKIKDVLGDDMANGKNKE